MANREREHCVAQKRGKERDLYTCQICGSTEKVEGHHIFNYQYGGAANIDNIVTLCQKCHKLSNYVSKIVSKSHFISINSIYFGYFAYFYVI